MPTLELRSFLEHQLEENPFLELDETRDDAPPAGEVESSQREGESGVQKFDEDWVSHWAAASEREEPNNDDGASERAIDQRMITPQSLHEWLRVQLGCQPLSAEAQRLGDLLIQRLDEHGYLEGALEGIAAECQAPLELVESALRVLQSFDPPGVAARDLRECLMLQLEQSGRCSSLAYRILKDHFVLFTQHRLTAIAKATGSAAEQVTQAVDCLKGLNPKPGRAFASDLPPSVIPDLIVHHRDAHYDVELNDQDMPHVGVNRAYYRMLKDPKTPSDAKEFLVNKFQRANWLIKAIDERNATLLSIARCLISLQRDFLERGPQALKPLTQAQVAKLVGRHASTVSRAISGKTIDTPFGVFRLEQLFASGVQQAAQTDSVSDERIKAEIRRLIESEDPAHPLSDSAIATAMTQQHIAVARRTIAKYRTALRLLPGHLRRNHR